MNDELVPRPDDKVYLRNEFAGIAKVHKDTLKRWDRQNILKAFRFPSGRPYYTDFHYRLISLNKLSEK